MMANRWKEKQRGLAVERTYDPSRYAEIFGLIDDPRAGAILGILMQISEGYSYVGSVMFYPDDDLYSVLGIDQNEISDVIESVVKRLGHNNPSQPVHTRPVSSVGELFEVVMELDHRLP